MNELISFIYTYLNTYKNVEYLLIVNHSALINDIKDSKKEFNINNLKEFVFISQQTEDYHNLIFALSLPSNDKNINIYEGYDTNDNLIFYRKGITIIQSFDLIELFKYNNNLTKIKLIKEHIIIKYNIERTKLEIMNINPNKNELNDIICNNIKISHFTQFIYNQQSLKEITILILIIYLNIC